MQLLLQASGVTSWFLKFSNRPNLDQFNNEIVHCVLCVEQTCRQVGQFPNDAFLKSKSKTLSKDFCHCTRGFDRNCQNLEMVVHSFNTKALEKTVKFSSRHFAL